MTDSASIGQRIRARRELLGKTQQDLAEALSTTRPNFSKYESGAVNISSPDLVRIARLLGVKASYLLGEEEEAENAEIIYTPIYDELRAASYNGDLNSGDVEEIAEIIEMKRKRRAKKRGAD